MRAQPKTTTDTAALPVDVETMRATAASILGPDDGPDVLPPGPEDTATLTGLLRGHLALLMPEVETAACNLGSNSIPRFCALACLGEARGKLRAKPSPVPGGEVAYARKLARVLAALCDHYATLTAPPTG